MDAEPPIYHIPCQVPADGPMGQPPMPDAPKPSWHEYNHASDSGSELKALTDKHTPVTLTLYFIRCGLNDRSQIDD
jgi:hypothetical protein